jgi:hypothetical protein
MTATNEHSGRVEHKGYSHQVIVNNQFYGCSTDPNLAERHLQNVISRLSGRDPATATMTIEQLFQDFTVRDPDLPTSQRRIARVVIFEGQRFFNVFGFNGDRPLSVRYCDLVEIEQGG